MRFGDRLGAAVREKGTAAVVGIDPVLERLPRSLRDDISTAEDAARAIAAFGRGVIESVATHVPLVKINIAFFEVFHEYGIAAFYQLVEAARDAGLLVIADIKRGDIGSTAALYARGHLANTAWPDLSARRIPDAVTLAGYLGRGAVQPFVDVCATTGRGVYVLVRPSDPGADQVHDFGGETERFYEFMGDLVSQWGTELIGENGLSAVGAVVAPKDASSTARLRSRLPHTPLLVPGYGAQGAGVEACRPCFSKTPGSAVVNASRSVIYAFDDNGGPDWRAAISEAAQRFAADIPASA